MSIEYWIPKATDTYSEYVIHFFHFHGKNKNAPRCYVYRYIACHVCKGDNIFPAIKTKILNKIYINLRLRMLNNFGEFCSKL